MKQDEHFISVVIPTTGRNSIETTQQSLNVQTHPPDEVIILLDKERNGPAWARNRGIEQAKGDLIAFTDDDCVPPPDWIESLAAAIDRHDADVVGGGYQQTDFLLSEIGQRKKRLREEMVDNTGLVGTGGNMMFHRKWLQKLIVEDGYAFNEDFICAEDWEITWRTRKYGGRVVYVPIQVKHFRKVTARNFFHQRYNHGRGIALLFLMQRKDFEPPGLHKSLLWGQPGTKKGAKWAKAVWQKGIGPFDVNSFSSRRLFFIFWLGEKVQALGFFRELLARKFKKYGS